jgi:hypothetical protein
VRQHRNWWKRDGHSPQQGTNGMTHQGRHHSPADSVREQARQAATDSPPNPPRVLSPTAIKATSMAVRTSQARD